MNATLVFGESSVDPAQLSRRTDYAAGGLQALGVGEGDVVAIMVRNDPVFIEAMFACRPLGAYSCPVNWHFKPEEAGHILRDSGARAIVIATEFLEAIRPAIPEGTAVILAEEWPAWRERQAPLRGAPRAPRGNMPYTSGTTGQPKGVRRAPADEAQRAAAMEVVRCALGLGAGARAYVSAPLYHSAPNTYALQAVLLAERLVLAARFDAEATLAAIERHRLTHLYLVPTMYVRMLALAEDTRRRYDLSSVGFVASTGSPCAPEVKRRMIDWWGPVFHESYASSEAGFITLIGSEEATARPGSAGRALRGATIRILDAEGREKPRGEVGLIYARHPAYVDFTYNNNPQARAAIERDGLWSVGDMGYLDAEGYLFVTDRQSDMVISGGVNIYPAEIEAVLAAMPGVADCAVFGIPDEEFGEALAAAVQRAPGANLDAASVQAFIRARIAGYKVPRLVTFHDALPREDSGKIFKRRLREPYWAGAGRRI